MPRQSHDATSAPASRRRVGRDASTCASCGVRTARPNRERGLLFFVLEACGRVRRRRGESARYHKGQKASFSFVTSSLSRILPERRWSETRPCGAAETRGAEQNEPPVVRRGLLLDARETPSRSTSQPQHTRRRGDVANGRRAGVVGIRESKDEASAEARLGERVVIPHEKVADGHFRSRGID